MGEPFHPMPAEHFRLWLLRSMLALIHRATSGARSLDDLLARHPALRNTIDEAAQSGLDGLTLQDALAQLDERLDRPPGEGLHSMRAERRAAPSRPAVPSGDRTAYPPGEGPHDGFPLERLRRAFGLDATTLSCFLLCGLGDEDPRLAPAIGELLGHDGRPSRTALARCFDAPRVPAALAELLAAGLLLEEPFGRWRLLSVPAVVWDVLRGLPPPAGAWRYTPVHALPQLAELTLPPPLRAAIAEQRAAARPQDLCWALRGVPGSGRRTLAGAIARAAGQGLIEAAAHHTDTAALGALATLLGAMPLLTVQPAPGERLQLPETPCHHGAIAVRMPMYGGLVVERRVCRWLELGLPTLDERQSHWRLALGGAAATDELAGLRIPRGTLHRVAQALPPACADPLAAVMAEVETRGRFALDGMAHRVAPPRPGEAFLMQGDAREEFDALAARCRWREALGRALPAAFGHASAAGVRALFKGPSGTGKTLAARHLAAQIGRPLYRVDLAATVSKYIGETERNLERVFEAAESLDIVLLFDEGDALMSGRTGVSNATDRYANLEVNYLLQRLEAYAGILVVTTNAPERIDTAFARRMDVTLEFPLPDADIRFDLWLAHLAADHTLSEDRLDEVALRCALSGGQIRNTALHATLLALQQGTPLGDFELLTALGREYRKAGSNCPSLSAGPLV
jgi:hypothetical protein